MTNKRFSDPWENMTINTRRRVSFQTVYDFFWIMDINMSCGFLVKLDRKHASKIIKPKLKGVSIRLAINNNEETELCFTLVDSKTRDIFLFAM